MGRRFLLGASIAIVGYLTGIISGLLGREKSILDYLDPNTICGEHTTILTSDPNDGCITVVRKNEADGVEELVHLTAVSSTEQSFAYIPKEQLWVEIGEGLSQKRATDDSFAEGIELDRRIVAMLVKLYAVVSYYHGHRNVNAIKGPISELENICEAEEEARYRRCDLSPQELLPSSNDMYTAILLSLAHFSKHTDEFRKKPKIGYVAQNPDAYIDMGICSQWGVTTISLTSKGYEYLHQLDDEQLKILAYRLRWEIKDSMFKNGKANLQCLTFLNDSDNNLRTLYSNDFLSVNFYPTSEIKNFKR